MSNLAYFEKLLDGVEVKWTALGRLAENLDSMRKPITSGLRESGTIPYYGASGIVDYVKDYIFDGDFLLVSEDGANLIARNTPIAFSISGKTWVNNHAHVLKFNTYVERRFVDIYLNSIDLTPYISGAAQPKLNQKNLNSILIPIPCPDNPKKSLAIQAEIVRILDAFTAMTAELTAELNMRKKQYNYYRDQLLSFEEGEVEWKTLGDISDFTYGYAAKAQESGDARFVRITDINTNGKLSPAGHMYVDISEENERYLLKKDDLLMARTGATFGKTMIFDEDYPAIYAGFLIKLSLDPNIVNPKYYWHFAQSDLFWDQANKLVSGGGQPQFNANALKQVKLPVPYPSDTAKSLAEQARIVLILDKFDAIASSLTEGLPREIELRQKQYEYYRDLLLSFPKSDEAA